VPEPLRAILIHGTRTSLRVGIKHLKNCLGVEPKLWVELNNERFRRFTLDFYTRHSYLDPGTWPPLFVLGDISSTYMFAEPKDECKQELLEEVRDMCHYMCHTLLQDLEHKLKPTNLENSRAKFENLVDLNIEVITLSKAVRTYVLHVSTT
jgi:hypothetical protein